MTLIEMHPGESDSDLRAVIDGILQTLDPLKSRWWHPYELHGIRRHGDKQFREFYCIAGSVEIWLWKLTAQSTTREILLLSNDAEPE